MYEALFHLQQRPFPVAPQVNRYFPAASIEQSRQVLVRCVQRAEGAGLVIGPSGTGKTLLCQILAEQHRGPFEVALLPGANLPTCRALLQAILFELGLPYRRLDDGELRLSLNDHLLHRAAEGIEGLVLIVDEAHTLPPRLLEEMRLLTNLARGGRPYVRLVLAGSPLLEERLAHPKLDSLNQRLSARCYLEPFTRDETLAYVRAQLELSGGRPDEILSTAALDAVHRATEGIPRLINQLCDHALLLAFADGISHIGAETIDQAWADLQQLPTPWGESRQRMRFDGPHRMPEIIEFSGLTDDAQFPDSPVETHSLGVLSPDSGDGSDDVEPFEVIERNLNILEAEFAPAEPQLVSHQSSSSDPFAEQFAEDEVVIDRYASLDAGGMRQLPHVYCQEGDLLSRLLQKAAPQTQSLEIVSVESHAEAEAARSMPTVSKASPVPEPLRLAYAEHSAPTSTAASTLPQPVTLGPVVAQTIEAPKAPGTSDEVTEPNLVVVEEDPEILPVTIQRPQARREEYRRLFAKLRHG